MTIPVYVLGALSLSLQVYLSDRYRKRAFFIVACCVPVAIGYLMPVWSKEPGVGYAGMFVLVIGKLHEVSCSTKPVDDISRSLSHFYAGRYLDHNQPGPGHQESGWPAFRVQLSEPIESHLWTALSYSTRSAIYPRQRHFSWPHDCCWILLCFVLVSSEEKKCEEGKIDC